MEKQMPQSPNPLVGQILEESRDILEKIDELRKRMVTEARGQLEIVHLDTLVEEHLGDELEIVGQPTEHTGSEQESLKQIECRRFLFAVNSVLLHEQRKVLEAFSAHEIDIDVLTRRNDAVIKVWQKWVQKAIKKYGMKPVENVINSVPQL